jgi:hypothetical protein|tara:strand:- start:605 stop:796 length:192 start_codon:yes stop_codon:yes gene_type:complete
MSNKIELPQKKYDQVLELLDQLISFCQHEDRLNNISDPMKYSGEGFMTAKLKLIQRSLKDESN